MLIATLVLLAVVVSTLSKEMKLPLSLLIQGNRLKLLTRLKIPPLIRRRCIMAREKTVVIMTPMVDMNMITTTSTEDTVTTES